MSWLLGQLNHCTRLLFWSEEQKGTLDSADAPPDRSSQAPSRFPEASPCYHRTVKIPMWPGWQLLGTPIPCTGLSCCSFYLIYSFNWLILERERKQGVWGGAGKRKKHVCIHWLILVCAPTRDWTHSLGVLGQHSNQLSYLARALLLILSILKIKVLRQPL